MVETFKNQNDLQFFDKQWGDPKAKLPASKILGRPSLASIVGQKVKFFGDEIKTSHQQNT